MVGVHVSQVFNAKQKQSIRLSDTFVHIFVDIILISDIGYRLLQVAYLTPLLHSLKYPAASVNGVLLGKSARSNDSVKITVVEAIPLLHAHIALSPMMDAAFCILDEYCRYRPPPMVHVSLI